MHCFHGFLTYLMTGIHKSYICHIWFFQSLFCLYIYIACEDERVIWYDLLLIHVSMSRGILNSTCSISGFCHTGPVSLCIDLF